MFRVYSLGFRRPNLKGPNIVQLRNMPQIKGGILILAQGIFLKYCASWVLRAVSYMQGSGGSRFRLSV